MKTFQAHETAWLLKLDGIELADFLQRALAFLLDVALAVLASRNALSANWEHRVDRLC